jgi:hypothetical protein
VQQLQQALVPATMLYLSGCLVSVSVSTVVGKQGPIPLRTGPFELTTTLQRAGFFEQTVEYSLRPVAASRGLVEQSFVERKSRLGKRQAKAS